MTGTDLEVEMVARTSLDGADEGEITLPARKLMDICRALPEGARVDINVERERAVIRSGRSRFSLGTLPAEEFPSLPGVDWAESWKMQAEDLHLLISRTSFAVSTEESRPILNGVLWQLKSESAAMVATNGHRLARLTVPLMAAGAPEADLIVPPKALQQVERLFEKEGTIEVSRSQNHLAFRTENRSVYTRLIEGPYPNYQQVIPTDSDKKATASRDELAAAIRRMAVVASDQTHRVRMGFSEGTLAFRVQTPDLGEAEEEMAVEYDGEALEIGFNANYLLEVLRYMPDEDVLMEFKAPERAATFLPASGEIDYLCLVMPLRLLD